MTEARQRPRLHRFYNKTVTVLVDTGHDEGGNPTFTSHVGKVITVSDAGLCLRKRNNTVIIDSPMILDIEEVGRPRRSRVVRRFVRVLDPDAPVKQHLADRHGVLVSVLNATDDATARTMHDNIDHEDLGHRHGDKPNRAYIEPGEAIAALEELRDAEDQV